MLFLLLDLLLAWVLDRLIGDPPGFPHPVNLIGHLISRLDRAWHPGPLASPAKAYLAGLVLCLATILASGGLVYGLLALSRLVHPILFHLLNIYLLYAALAGRCLEVEARKVEAALAASAAASTKDQAEDGLDRARFALSMLVSRDTSQLDQPAIVRATVETVAENTVDGVLSPLFWIMVGFGLAAGLSDLFGEFPVSVTGGSFWLLPLGTALAWAFKAASTLDSRVGYKTERYLWFGRASARLDDALNWLPARLVLFLMPVAAAVCRLDARAAWRLGWRDRLKHASPNSAHAESAVAGALCIALGGPAVYHGRLEDKPVIGEANRPPEPVDIARACRLMVAASTIFLIVGLLGLGLAGLVWLPVATEPGDTFALAAIHLGTRS